MIKCSGCGSMIEENNQYCPICGTVIAQQESVNLNKEAYSGWGDTSNSNQTSVDLNKGAYSGWGDNQSMNNQQDGAVFEGCDTSGSALNYSPNEASNIGVNIISFIIPIIGILFIAFFWKGERNTRKYDTLCTCVAISMCLSTLLPVLISFLVLIFAVLFNTI